MMSARSAVLRVNAPAAILRTLMAFVAVLLFAAPPAAFAQSGATADYVLGAGDKLRIQVFGEEDLSGEFEIDGGGRLSFPLIGEVAAGGKTVRTLVADLQARLADGYLRDPRVSIEVINYRPFTILGEVRNPGSYPYKNGMSVYEAVGLAGGFTYRADEDEVEIKRGDQTGTYPADETTKIMPGDVIRVGERFF